MRELKILQNGPPQVIIERTENTQSPDFDQVQRVSDVSASQESGKTTSLLLDFEFDIPQSIPPQFQTSEGVKQSPH
jgi:hypothetical protein